MHTYMNDERHRLHTEIVKSQNNHSAAGGRRHYDYNTAAGRLREVLPKKFDVTKELDVFSRAYGEMPAPPTSTGLGRAQAAGIEHQRKVMFSAIEEVRKQIKADFRHLEGEEDRIV